MFAESPQRLPAHAGAAYPVDRNEFAETMMRYLGDKEPANDGLIGIAAPHVSPRRWLVILSFRLQRLERKLQGPHLRLC